MSDDSLLGFTVAVTADRRREELAMLLERRGAKVVLAPALRIVPLADDAELLAATEACVETPPDVVMANTGIGMRGWLAAAEGWGLYDRLRGVLSDAYLVARGPKARGAIRAAGLGDDWSPASESCDEVIEHLLARGVAGQVVAMQLHGEREPERAAALQAAGASVIEIPVYRWAPPVDRGPLLRLVELICARSVDAVAFTSAPAVEALLRAAGPCRADVIERLRHDIIAACVGPITAAPLEQLGIPVAAPTRTRLGALVRVIEQELPRRQRVLHVAGHTLALRGHGVVVDGEAKLLAPAPMMMLRALAEAPGRVLTRAALLSMLARGADEHAVEMTVARLRTALGVPSLVQTVARRGYRLSIDDLPMDDEL